MVVRGIPSWYKELLLKKQFEKEDNDEKTTVIQTPGSEEIEGMHSGEPEAGPSNQP